MKGLQLVQEDYAEVKDQPWLFWIVEQVGGIAFFLKF